MNKVLLAMSGGTDSSVAAMLLKHKKYELTGMTFRAYDYITNSCIEKESGCCSVDSIFEAKNLAKKLGFEHHILDIRDYFDKTVIQNFIDEYLSGRTPNPCVVCNETIKWNAMIKEADRLKCEYLATGHYAKIINDKGRYYIQKGKDESKDQSYFLWTLSQDNLAKTLFPLGDLTKIEVRKIAEKTGFKKIAEKKESQEICFVENDNYRDFLRERIKNIDSIIGEGNIYDSSGKKLGTHKGYPFYTIGQRKGLNIAVGYPIYVTKIDAKNNEIILGNKEDLKKYEITIDNINLMKYKSIKGELKVNCKIRYKSPPEKCTISMIDNNKIHIKFDNPVYAVTPGQSAVFYENNDLVGGGLILS